MNAAIETSKGNANAQPPTPVKAGKRQPSVTIAGIFSHLTQYRENGGDTEHAAAKRVEHSHPAPSIAEILSQFPVGVRAKQGAKILGIGESTFWRYAKDYPDFPRGRKLTARTTIFLTAELLAWRDSKAAA